MPKKAESFSVQTTIITSSFRTKSVSFSVQPLPSNVCLSAVSNKGFGTSSSSSSSSSVIQSVDDKKREKTIEGLERWAKRVGIL